LPDRLNARQRHAVATPENHVAVSTATVWEIAIKVAIGRLVFPIDEFDDIAQRMGFEPLPIRPAHAIIAGSLPRQHADPFVRMLIAQAMVEKLVLVTSDGIMGHYGVQFL
jgi:PIN domain nuclease of toxin-antitoxin system